MLLDLHSSTFHNCTPNRISLADSLAERERERKRDTPSSVERLSIQIQTHAPDTNERFRVQNIRGTDDKNKGDETSGHARTEIRRRYAIAWVEYIDLSRFPSTPITPSLPPLPPPPPPPPRRLSEFLLVTSNPTLSSIVENPRFPPALYFNSDSPLSASRSRDIRAEHYCPWYWRCRPCYARTSRIDPRGIYPYPRLWPVDDIMPRDGLSYHQNFFSLVVSKRYRGTPFPRTLFVTTTSAMIREIANPCRAFHILFFYYLILCFNICVEYMRKTSVSIIYNISFLYITYLYERKVDYLLHDKNNYS